jgi:hypothetical protein
VSGVRNVGVGVGVGAGTKTEVGGRASALRRVAANGAGVGGVGYGVRCPRAGVGVGVERCMQRDCCCDGGTSVSPSDVKERKKKKATYCRRCWWCVVIALGRGHEGAFAWRGVALGMSSSDVKKRKKKKKRCTVAAGAGASRSHGGGWGSGARRCRCRRIEGGVWAGVRVGVQMARFRDGDGPDEWRWRSGQNLSSIGVWNLE